MVALLDVFFVWLTWRIFMGVRRDLKAEGLDIELLPAKGTKRDERLALDDRDHRVFELFVPVDLLDVVIDGDAGVAVVEWLAARVAVSEDIPVGFHT